jgi:hypothetical protein
MLVRFKKEYEGRGAGFVADLPDDQAQAAVSAGAAEPLQRVRLSKDFASGGQRFAANLEYDLTAGQLADAKAAGAVPDDTEAKVETVPTESPRPRRVRHGEGE